MIDALQPSSSSTKAMSLPRDPAPLSKLTTFGCRGHRKTPPLPMRRSFMTNAVLQRPTLPNLDEQPIWQSAEALWSCLRAMTE
jgi:hypothetical protein